MAKQNKTTETNVNVSDFIEAFVENNQKKADSFQLIELMREWSGFEPKMWGPSIIGFGSYHYKYTSGREGDAPLIAFSPRKDAFSLYVHPQTEATKDLLPELGRYKIAKACIYIKKLSDINVTILEKICRETFAYLEEHHECSCHRQ